MTAIPNQSSPAACRRLLPALLAAATLSVGAAKAQGAIESQPFGAPSQAAPGRPVTLGLYLADARNQPTLRLEGGTPGALATLVFGAETADVTLRIGGTLLVGAPVGMASGTFDEDGVFVLELTGARFDGHGDRLYVQGLQPAMGGFATGFSGGVALQRRLPECAPVDAVPSIPEAILVEEIGALLQGQHLEAALDLALNSAGDSVTIDLNGELQVPVGPGVTAGGKVAFSAGVTRGEDEAGAVYDLAIGSDVAVAAGVGVGVAGLGVSGGAGAEVIWRLGSAHQVARAIRSMAILQAIGPNLQRACQRLDGQLADIDRLIGSARSAADRARQLVRSRRLLQRSPLLQRALRRLDELRAERRRIADRVFGVAARLIGWVADERAFLDAHAFGCEVRMTVTAEASVGTGLGEASDGGEVTGANVGASAAVGIERRHVQRVELVDGAGTLRLVSRHSFTRSIAGSAGMGIGGAAAARRVIELSTAVVVGPDGVQRGASGTTVSLTVDGKVMAALGAFVTGQAGVGGEVSVQLRLADLLGYSRDAIAILLGDDDHAIAALLRALPIEVVARGRYEAGFAAGVGVDVDGAFKGGVSASIMLADRGTGFTYVGGSNATTPGADVVATLMTAMHAGPLATRDQGPASKLAEVRGEVERVMSR